MRARRGAPEGRLRVLSGNPYFAPAYCCDATVGCAAWQTAYTAMRRDTYTHSRNIHEHLQAFLPRKARGYCVLLIFPTRLDIARHRMARELPRLFCTSRPRSRNSSHGGGTLCGACLQ
jgi:hypothetical protein